MKNNTAMSTPYSVLAAVIGLMFLLVGAGALFAPPACSSSSSTTTGGVNVIVGETTQPDRITLLRAGNYMHQTRGALKHVFEVSIKNIEVNIFSTACTKGSAVTVNIEPTIISCISGTNTIVASVTGEQIHVNPGKRSTSTSSLINHNGGDQDDGDDGDDDHLAYHAGGELNSPALDIDFRFWFRGQSKSVSLDGSYLKVNLDGVRFGAPSIGGKLTMSGPFSPDSIPQGLTQFSYQ
ncbi:MAG: hypothetical protein CJBNEKGG_00243 [Prosthecobacter sp.]|nr:hypothetical protein [Prosthecobacter sp.]